MTVKKMSFHWSNYTRPTPENLAMFVASIRRLVAVIAGFTVVMESNKWIPLGIIFVGALLDELKNFFAYAAAGEKEVVSVSFPSAVADQVEVKTEIKKET